MFHAHSGGLTNFEYMVETRLGEFRCLLHSLSVHGNKLSHTTIAALRDVCHSNRQAEAFDSANQVHPKLEGFHVMDDLWRRAMEMAQANPSIARLASDDELRKQLTDALKRGLVEAAKGDARKSGLPPADEADEQRDVGG